MRSSSLVLAHPARMAAPHPATKICVNRVFKWRMPNLSSRFLGCGRRCAQGVNDD
jgi:hypothetical protein